MIVHRSDVQGVTTLTIDRPPANALDLDAVVELLASFEALATEPPQLGVVLTGTGSIFSAGVDTRAFAGYENARRRELALAITRMTAAVLALPCPLVTAVNGHALGGGFVLMLCGDRRIAVDDPAAKFGITEARAGVPFPSGPLLIIQNELPQPLLRRLALSSQVVSPEDLLKTGVVDQLTPADTLLASAQSIVGELAAQPAFAVVKQQVRGTLAAQVRARAKESTDPFLDSFG